MDTDTLLRKTYFKDTTVINYIYKDSIPDPMQRALIIIDAAGSECMDDWPILKVEVNGIPERNIKVAKSNYNQYWFNVRLHEIDVDSIRITFGNDRYIQGVCDRNCYVKSVMINHHEYLEKSITNLSGYIWWMEDETHTVSMASNGSILIKSHMLNYQYGMH